MKPKLCPSCGSDDIGYLDSVPDYWAETDEDYEKMGGRYYCVTCSWISERNEKEEIQTRRL